MSLSVDFAFDIYNAAGDQVVFIDTTPANSANTPDGYGSPNIARSAVTQIRLLISNYPAIQAQQTFAEGDTLLQYHKYIKTAGASHIYDNKVILAGDYFIPFVAGLTVLTGDEFQDTGTYSPYISPTTFLPATNITQLILNISQLGFTGSYTTVPDVVFDNQYEVYGPVISVPFTTVAGQQYIVFGTSGTAVFNGDTYRPGEVFIGDGTTFSTLTGSAHLSALQSITEKTKVTTYNLEMSAYQLNIKNLTTNCTQVINPDIKIANIYSLIQALKWQNYTNAVSFQKATDLIRLTNTKIATLNTYFS